MGLDVCKRCNQRHLLKRADAYNLQNVGQAKTQPEFFADDGGQDIDAHGDPYLSLGGVVGGAEEVLNAEVLLDSFEEQFDAPTQLVEHGNDQSGQLEVIGQKAQDLAVLRIAITDTAQSLILDSQTIKVGDRGGVRGYDVGKKTAGRNSPTVSDSRAQGGGTRRVRGSVGRPAARRVGGG